MRRLPLLLTLTMLAASEPAVSVKVYPQVVPAGQATRVTCRVPRDARNRGVTIGIAGYRTSYDQIDGDGGGITHAVVFGKVPCGADTAFCDLEDNMHGHSIARAPFEVVGCGEGR